MKGVLRGVDKTLFWTIAFLLLAGLITLGSASVPISIKHFGHAYYYLLRQIILGVGVGGILFYLGLRAPLALFQKYAFVILVAAMFLVALVFVPGIGFSAGGARRWILIGPLSFQPSEMLKFAFVLYLSAWLQAKQKNVGDAWLGLAPFLLMVSLVGSLLVAEPDFGTLGVLIFTSFALFFIGGGKTKQIVIAGIAGFLLLGSIIAAVPYARARVQTFLNPDADTSGSGYQVTQARIAIGSGGFFGRGLGLSRQKFYYLPEPAGDAVFAVYSEEFGFVGVLVLIGAFFLLFLRGMVSAARAKTQFARFLAAGLTLLVIMQTTINMGALSGLIPLTGIPLPFLSYGGTALAFLLFEMGILLRISSVKELA